MRAPRYTHFKLGLSLVAALAGLTGCRGQISEDTPVVPIRNMYNQPRYDSQSRSPFFQDGRTMRPPVEGAVAREMPINLTVHTGRTANNVSWLLEIPGDAIRDFHPSLDAEDYQRAHGRPPQRPRLWGQLSAPEQTEARRAMLEEGHDQYNIYCAPCHSVAGDGEGPVAQRIAWLVETRRDPNASPLNAPSLHTDAIRTMPDGQIYGAITNGVRNMPAYAHMISNADRWAIVAYVRALQLNQVPVQTALNDSQETGEEALR